MIAIPQRLALKLAIGCACIALVALLVHDRNRWKSKTEHYSQLLADERAAHAASVANVRAAADQARRADALNASRVKTEQAAINERTINDFEARIAAARAAAVRLRAGAQAATPPGSRRAAPVPGLSAAPEGTAQGPREDGLPVEDRLIATEQAIQLDELIKWVRSQAAVGVSKD